MVSTETLESIKSVVVILALVGVACAALYDSDLSADTKNVVVAGAFIIGGAYVGSHQTKNSFVAAMKNMQPAVQTLTSDILTATPEIATIVGNAAQGKAPTVQQIVDLKPDVEKISSDVKGCIEAATAEGSAK